MRRAAVLLAVCLLASLAAPAIAGASTGSPVGSFDVVTAVPGGLHVQGWARDPDSSAAVTVHVYVDGRFAGSSLADGAYPGVGLHGIRTDVPANAGSHTVCVYALSIGPGDNTLLGCRSVFKPANPYGSVDSVVPSGAGPVLRGWAIDPDTYSSIQVHVYVDGAFAGQGPADLLSPDVNTAVGWQGDHRYEITLPLSPGPHQVCAYGINVGAGTNALLACRVLAPPVNPFGALELATANHQTGRVNVHGWAIDPSTAGPISVDFWADGVPVAALTAGLNRPDIARVFRFGAAHGFGGAIPVPANASTLCAYGINVGAGGANQLLGCVPINRTGDPFGQLQGSTTACNGGFAGQPFDVWAIDPDTAAPVDIAVYTSVNGALTYDFTARADKPAPDPGFVGQYPQFGPNHWSSVCSTFSNLNYYAINAPGTPGTNQFLGSEPALLHPGGS